VWSIGTRLIIAKNSATIVGGWLRVRISLSSKTKKSAGDKKQGSATSIPFARLPYSDEFTFFVYQI